MYSRIAAYTLKQPPVVEIVGMSVYKRPATSVGRLMQRPASKKNAKVNTPAQLPLLKQCSICHGHLVDRTDEAAIECTILWGPNPSKPWQLIGKFAVAKLAEPLIGLTLLTKMESK